MLTDQDKKMFNKRKHCMLCERKFDQQTQKKILVKYDFIHGVNQLNLTLKEKLIKETLLELYAHVVI